MSTFDPKAHCEQRLERSTWLEGVGYLGLGQPFNEWMYRVRHRTFKRVVSRHMPVRKDRALLDVGSGTGSDLTTTAVDRRSTAHSGMSIFRTDISAADAPLDRTYDALKCMDLLFHSVHDARANFKRGLKPVGLLFISDNFTHVKTLHGRHFVNRSWAEYEAAPSKTGFRVVEHRPVFRLLNRPTDPDPPVFHRWRALVGWTYRRSYTTRGLLAMLAYPFEFLFVNTSREGGSTGDHGSRTHGMMRVLHIVAWYPNHDQPHQAQFIERHIASLAPHAVNTVWHITVRGNEPWSFLRKSLKADRTFVVSIPRMRYFFLEWIAAALILWAWYTRRRSIGFDVVNFHIAYPNCTRNRLLRWAIGLPLVITEHWSAFNRKFSSNSPGIDRIRRIFHSGIPIIVVSKALERDIVEFAGPPRPVAYIVDNAVDPAVFHPESGTPVVEGVFFTIAGWRMPKRPDVVLDALACLHKMGYAARLRMAGTGHYMEAMLAQIDRLGLAAHVDLLGQLDEHQVAEEMRQAHALVHASDYETYSAVCAEALCCGTPVIASRVGGIPEFVDERMGVLVGTNDPEEWATAWASAWVDLLRIDRQRMAHTMEQRAGMAQVGERYAQVLGTVVRNAGAGSLPNRPNRPGATRATHH